MAARKLVVFKHESRLGEAPAHTLFEKVKAEKNSDIVVPRSFDDYKLSVPAQGDLPKGVELLLPCE